MRGLSNGGGLAELARISRKLAYSRKWRLGAPSLSLSQSVPLSVTQNSKHARIGTSECVIFRATPRVLLKRSGTFLLFVRRELAVCSCVARSRPAIATLLCIHITGLVRRYMATLGWKFKSVE